MRDDSEENRDDREDSERLMNMHVNRLKHDRKKTLETGINETRAHSGNLKPKTTATRRLTTYFRHKTN